VCCDEECAPAPGTRAVYVIGLTSGVIDSDVSDLYIPLPYHNHKYRCTLCAFSRRPLVLLHLSYLE